MRGQINDRLRSIISAIIPIAGVISTTFLRLRIALYTHNQKRLKRKYGITTDTPVLPYGRRVEQSIQAKAPPRARFAKTSGSTGRCGR